MERVDYLFRHNQNRVLVAVEVGMGKTLIARGAIVKTARLRIEEKDDNQKQNNLHHRKPQKTQDTTSPTDTKQKKQEQKNKKHTKKTTSYKSA